MKTLKKISITFILAIMICALSVNAFAASYTHNNFSFNFKGCVYTSVTDKTSDNEYVTICFTEIGENDVVKVTICNDAHGPVSDTITISGESGVKYIPYNSWRCGGGLYYLKFCSDKPVSVSGYWIP